MGQVTLVTGGVRSGKSRYALEAARKASPRLFLATALPFDGEMKDRIVRHKEERGAEFVTVEEPEHIASVIRNVAPEIRVMLVDCLTVWIGNLMHRHGDDKDWFPQIDEFLDSIKSPACDVILVTNEVGMGIVPEYPMARRFRDIAGMVNARVAAIASRVVFMVSGIPMVIKGGGATC